MEQQLAERLGPSREVEHRLRRTLRSLRHGPGVRRLHATERRLPRARGMCRTGCGARGRRQGQGGPRDRPLRAAGSRVAISRAGRRPPAHTAARSHKAAHRSARNTSGAKATQRQARRRPTQAYKNRHPDRMSASGGARGIRTPDLLIANETRYQLRHSPKDSNSLAPSQSAMQADRRRVRESTKPQARQQFHGPTGAPATARVGVR